jgi:pyruvate formate lyase activating enzyme
MVDTVVESNPHHRALLYEPLDGLKVRCNLCGHRCVVSNGRLGVCGVRKNVGGELKTLVYGRVCSINIDPIEKKPLFHFLPGSMSLSVATVGCNFHCEFCQNHEISQYPRDVGGIMGETVTPEELVNAAEDRGCRSISYTYTEPTVFFEFALDTARLASERGIRNVFVTNGYMTPEAIELVSPYLDAANVDFKSADAETYHRIMRANQAVVKESIHLLREAGVWVEVTTLVIPGMNDDPDGLREIADFIRRVDPGIPWHVSRFHPQYRMKDRPVTPLDTLKAASEIGLRAGLRYIYSGNVPGEQGENTNCHACGRLLIERWGFTVRGNHLRNGACPGCGTRIDGVWST